jgi:hypothetical protein
VVFLLSFLRFSRSLLPDDENPSTQDLEATKILNQELANCGTAMANSTRRAQEARYAPVPDDSDLLFEKDGGEERVEDLMPRPRQSRIPYKGLFFALLTLYLVSAALVLLSYQTKNRPLILSQKLLGPSTSVFVLGIQLTKIVKRVMVTFNEDKRFDGSPDAENSPWNEMVPCESTSIRPVPDLTLDSGNRARIRRKPSKMEPLRRRAPDTSAQAAG